MTRKVQPGQVFVPPSAMEQNRIATAVDLAARVPLSLDSPNQRLRQRDPFIVTAQNISGYAKRRGEATQINRTPVLMEQNIEQIRATAADPWQGGVIAYPVGRYLPKTLGIWLDPCPHLGWARVQVAGVCTALVYLNDDQDNYADFDVAEDRLISTTAGAVQIIQKPSGVTGEQTCLINLSRQEEGHLVGIPVGNGITAFSGEQPGTGVVALYFQHAGTLYPVLEPDGTTPVYLTVYSLSDDPIIPNTANTFGGYGYVPGYGTAEFCLLHRDMYGTWWIDPMPHAKVALLYLIGNRADLQYPSDPTDYLILDTTLGSLANLDVNVLQAYGSPGYEQNGIAKLLLTGDYTVTLSWSGGVYYGLSVPVIASWGALAFASVTVTLQYLPPGGGWTTLVSSAASRYTDGVGQYPDVTGGSYTTSLRLTAGTLFRATAAIGVQYPSGTAKLDTTGLRATVNVIKHA